MAKNAKNRKKVLSVILVLSIFMTNPIISSSIYNTIKNSPFSGILSALGVDKKSGDDISYNDSDTVKFGNSKIKKAVLSVLKITDKDFRSEVEDLTYADVKDYKELDLSGYELDSLKGLEYFTGLTKLNLSNNLLKNIDLSKNINLIELDASNNYLTNITLTGLTKLTKLNLDYNDFSSIDLSVNEGITNLSINNNELTSLTLPTSNKIQELNLSANDLLDVDFLSRLTELRVLSLDNNNIINVNLSISNKLETLSISDNNISNLQLSNSLSALKSIKASNNNISRINLDTATSITELILSNNDLSDINLNSNTTLTKLDLSKNRLATLDLSSNTALTDVNVSYNQLTSLKFKSELSQRKLITNYNFLSDPIGKEKIQLIGSEKKVDEGNTLSVDHNDFYVVYGQRVNDSDDNDGDRFFKKLSSSHILVKGDTKVQDTKAFNQNDQALGNGAIKREYSLNIPTLGDSVEGITHMNSNNITQKSIYKANLYAYVDNGIYDDNDFVPFVDDNFKQAIIKKIPALREKQGISNKAEDRDIKYSDVKDHLNFKFDSTAEYYKDQESCSDEKAQELAREIPIAIRKAESSIGVSYFTNANVFVLAERLDDGTHNSMLGLDLSNNSKLTSIVAPGSQISSIILPNSAIVSVIYLGENNISEIDLSNNSNLNKFQIAKNNLTNIDISNNKHLSDILLSKNKISNITFATEYPHLISLKFKQNNIYGDIDLSFLSSSINLNSITLSNNRIKSVTLPNSTSLNSLYFENNRISTLDFSNTPNITTLVLSNNPIKTLDTSDLNKLTALQLFKTGSDRYATSPKLYTLNVESSIKLKTLHVYGARLEGKIDLSNNIALTGQLALYNNRLDEIILPNNISASRVFVHGNRLSSINTNNLPPSTELRINNNQIHTVNTYIIDKRFFSFNFLSDSTNKNQLKFIGYQENGNPNSKAYSINLDASNSVDLKNAVGYDQNFAINGDSITKHIPISTDISQKFKVVFDHPKLGETLLTENDFIISDSVITPKQGVIGTARVRVILENADASLYDSSAKTENYIEVNVGGSYVELQKGNDINNPASTDAYLYRNKNYRDPGFTIRNSDGTNNTDLSLVKRKVTKVYGDGANKSFILDPISDYSLENVDFAEEAKVVGINDIFGEYKIEYYITEGVRVQTRKLYVIDQKGDINRDGQITGDIDILDPNTNTETDAQLLMKYLGNVSNYDNILDLSDITDQSQKEKYKLYLADVNNDGIISLTDVDFIKNHFKNTATSYFTIRQKYTFLVPETN